MLGEKLGEELGQLTGTRVLPTENGAPVVEVSFEANGTLFDEHVSDIGTYRSVLRPDGTLYGDGQGVIMTESGAGITWKGNGVGQFTGRGNGVRWRGAIYFQTASEKFARLNKAPGIFEFETDETGKAESKTWEWI